MFRVTELGEAIWVDTPPEEAEAFEQSLLSEQDRVTKDLQEQTNQQLQSLASKVIQGAINLSASNTKLLRTIENLKDKKPVDIVIPVGSGLQSLTRMIL